MILDKVRGVHDIPIVLANALDELALTAMCQSTTLVINCTGPFRLFGEPVVRCCVAAGTHYVDISGEPQFIETMMLRYNEDARKNACVVVSACGFDSVPSDLGTVFTAQQFPKGGACSSIEAFISTDGKRAHATTYECIVLGLAAADELKTLRGNVAPVHLQGADASIVRNSQRHLVSTRDGAIPCRFAIYATFESVWTLVYLVVGGLFLFSLGSFKAGRALLIQYPQVFTFGFFNHAGPTEEELATTSFTFQFYAKGYTNIQSAGTASPDWQVVTTVHGPEPGYIATSRMVTRCAKVLLDGHVVPRGVLTTASAFGGTPLISELQQAGITFTVDSCGPVQPESF
ncbi:hypothetical protein DYB36_005557 [Aphanomyces astaci]|uniref:Saccharopine dehydrogenase NADP binding domain-containing protein n=1 Tax=Aphanomyces astaci TaxID=112090 RepID=A0A396ZPT4_APHAT|nr:hypothetical protein DYB36_005557 [Aphanomyces astaci]